MRLIPKKIDLAKAVGLSRPQLDQYLAKPGAPKEQDGGWDLDAVLKFILEKTKVSSVAANIDDDFDKLRRWDVYERARKTKIANDAKEKTLISRADHDAEISSQAKACQRILYQLPSRMAPLLSGLGPIEIEAKLNAAIDEAVREIGETK